MLITLFFIFAKIGLFTFGGGYAMISIIEDICVRQKKWITHEEMMNMTVVAESTPGPIAINCATFIGYKQKLVLYRIRSTPNTSIRRITCSIRKAILFSVSMLPLLPVRKKINSIWSRARQMCYGCSLLRY